MRQSCVDSDGFQTAFYLIRLGGGNGKAFKQMRFVFRIVGDGDRQICHADACRNFTVHQQIVFAQAVFAGFVFAETTVRAQSCRRRNERSVHIAARQECRQEMACGIGAVVNGFGEVGCIDNLQIRRGIQAACATDD